MLSAHVEYSTELYCFNSKAGDTAGDVNEMDLTQVQVSLMKLPLTFMYEYMYGSCCCKKSQNYFTSIKIILVNYNFEILLYTMFLLLFCENFEKIHTVKAFFKRPPLMSAHPSKGYIFESRFVKFSLFYHYFFSTFSFSLL